MKRKIGIVALALMLVAVFVGLVACDNPTTDNTAYTITVKAADNGKVAVNAKSATAGTEITVTVTANTGYKVSEVKMNGTALTVTDGKATFKMPAANVEITATFVLEEQPAPGQHKVTVSTVKRYRNGDIRNGRKRKHRRRTAKRYRKTYQPRNGGRTCNRGCGACLHRQRT